MAKKTPSGADTAPVLYTVLEPLRLDGADYQVGDSIELTNDVAASLLAANRSDEATKAGSTTDHVCSIAADKVTLLNVDIGGNMSTSTSVSTTASNSRCIPTACHFSKLTSAK